MSLDAGQPASGPERTILAPATGSAAKTRRPCTNCEGVGSCGAGRGNRFVCTICNGEGWVDVPVEAVPQAEPEAPAAADEVQPKEEVVRTAGEIHWVGDGFKVNITLTIQCLLATAGVFLGFLGLIMMCASTKTAVIVVGLLILLAGLGLLVKAYWARIRACTGRLRAGRRAEAAAGPDAAATQPAESSPEPAGSV
mmetsp:Transcript_20921/g.64588  ORF Transcript_20921/g.64588 Transcript_20921/m.64588 type:complete len:196 (-) Transcript_20921:167-754(-)